MIVTFFTFYTEKDDHSFRLLQNLGKCPRKFKVKKPKNKNMPTPFRYRNKQIVVYDRLVSVFTLGKEREPGEDF